MKGEKVFLMHMGVPGTVSQVVTDHHGMPIGYVVDVESQYENFTDVFRTDEVEDFDVTKDA